MAKTIAINYGKNLIVKRKHIEELSKKKPAKLKIDFSVVHDIIVSRIHAKSNLLI